MHRSIHHFAMSTFVLCLFLVFAQTTNSQTARPIDQDGLSAEQNARFVENKGQIRDQHGNARPDVLFSGAAADLHYHLRKDGHSYQLWKPEQTEEQEIQEKHPGPERPEARAMTAYRTDINWINANADVRIERENPVDGKDHYYFGRNENNLRDIRSFETVYFRGLFDGIDLKYYSRDGQLEYDFLVDAGANYDQIRWKVAGATNLSINSDGQLIIQTPLGEILEDAPVAFQNNTARKARWMIYGEQEVGFEVYGVDAALPLVIDPVVGVRDWGTYYGGVGAEWNPDVSVGPDGSVYLCGSSQSLGNIATSGSFQSTANLNLDAFLVKFNANGNRIWGTYYGGAEYDYGISCKVDADHNVYMAGDTESPGMATSGTHRDTLWTVGSFGGLDGFLVKFDSSGVRKWATYLGGDLADVVADLAIDEQAGLYVAGYTNSEQGISTPGAFQPTTPSFANNTTAAMLIKFDSSGVRQWGTFYAGFEYDYGFSCTTDQANNVYLVGNADGGFAGVTSLGAHAVSNPAVSNVYLAKFNSNGVRQWATFYAGGAILGTPASCATDDSLNVYLCGQTTNLVDVATAGAFQTQFAGNVNLGYGYDHSGFLVKFDSNGTRKWGTYLGPYYTSITDCSVTASQDIVVVGNTAADSMIATTGSHQTTKAGTQDDGFVAKFNPQGKQTWSTYLGGVFGEGKLRCAAGPNDAIYVTGLTGSPISPNIYSPGAHQLSYQGNGDAFLVKLEDCNAVYDTVFVAAIDSFPALSGSNYLTTSGLYADSFLTAAGCDSINFVQLTILNSSMLPLNTTACDAYTSPSGLFSWSASGTYQDTVLTAPGNDTVIDITLTILQSSTATATAIACASVTAPSGKVWTSSGVYNDTLVGQNAVGCDSIITYTVTINQSITSLNITQCGSYTAPSGQILYSNGLHFDTLVGANPLGCDSIFEINFTLLPSRFVFSYDTVCGPFIAPSGNVYTTSGFYPDTNFGGNVFGCDSLVRYNLVIYNGVPTPITTTVCGSYTSPSGKVWTTSGTYADTLFGMGTNGCDSTFSINLTVNQSNSGIVNVASCYNYTSPSGKFWTSPGTYLDTLIGGTTLGCDSFMTINLTILQSTFSQIAVTSCPPYASPSGKSWLQSGTYLDTLVGANSTGCDSIITVDLTALPIDTNHISPSACLTYTSPSGKVWNSSGQYKDTLFGAGANGCDSLFNIDLTILQNKQGGINVTTCDSYTTPNGNVLTTSGTYTETLVGAASNGCDSIHIIFLNINQSTFASVTDTSCVNYTFASGNTVNSSGIYQDTLFGANSVGCDLIITYDLTITPVNKAIQQTDTSLIAQASPALYQWLDCANGFAPIPGETAAVFLPVSNGFYAVAIEENGCADTSSCAAFQFVGIDQGEEAKRPNITIFPNPTNGQFTVQFEQAFREVELLIRDATGRVLYRDAHGTVNSIESRLDLASGTYFVEIRSEKQTLGVFPIVRQ